MIEIFRKALRDADMQRSSVVQKGSWVSVTDPSEREIDFLVDDLKLERGHIMDALDPFEVPRLEMEGNAAYIFLRFPYDMDGSIQTMPLLLVATEDCVVTVTKDPHHLFDDFLSGKIHSATTQKTKFLLLVFIKINVLYQSYLHSINRDIRAKQANVEKVTEKDVIAFVDRERVLNDFITSLVPASGIYKTLLSKQYLEFLKEDNDVVEDLMLGNEEAIDICEASIKAIANIRGAYATILANDLNRVMKLLAAVTIILTFPTMLMNIFSMNIKLPLQTNPLAFPIIVIIGIIISIVVYAFFAKKDWI